MRGLSTGFGKYSFYDCGAYGLFTISTERIQPTHVGKKAYSPEKFFAERHWRPIDPQKIGVWRSIGGLLSVLGPTITVIDGGGYIGNYSIPLALAAKASGLSLTVHAFEPGPAREVLVCNVATNALSDVINVHDCALSGYDGLMIYRALPNDAISGAVFGLDKEGQIERVVPASTIDTICADINGPLFIKLDTQGYETRIVPAAKQTIEKKRAIWQIEFMPWSGRFEVGGKPFHSFLSEHFHVFEGARQISPTEMPSFMSELEGTQKKSTDLFLIPMDAPFTYAAIKALAQTAAD